MARAVAVGLIVATLLIAPAVLALRGGESGASPPDPRDAAATRLCLDHGGVGRMLSDRVVCADGAPHGLGRQPPVTRATWLPAVVV